MRKSTTAYLLDSVVGTGTALPVTAVTADLRGSDFTITASSIDADDRRHLVQLARARRIVTELRAAGFAGSVTVKQAGLAFLGAAPVAVIVTSPSGRRWRVDADAGRSGRLVGGPFGGEALASTYDSDGALRPGHHWVPFGDDPKALRSALRIALTSAVAHEAWARAVAEIGVDHRVRLARFGAFDSGFGIHVAATSGPAGHVIAHLDEDGHVSRLSQQAGGSYVPDDGAFGKFLRQQYLESLQVEQFSDFFGPFIRHLHALLDEFVGATTERERVSS